MNKRSILILGTAALSGAIAIAVVVKKRVLRGSGNVITQDRTVDAFSGVSLSAIPGIVYVEQADQASIQVVADDNLVNLVQTAVVDGTLFVKLDSGGKIVLPTKPVAVQVGGPRIQHLHVEGKGKMEVRAIKADEFSIYVNGIGDIKGGSITARKVRIEFNGIGNCVLSGSSEEQDVIVNGIGKYNGAELDTQKTHVVVSGIGDIDVRVKEELTVQLSGRGKVKYYGNPKVTSNVARPGIVMQAPESAQVAAPAADTLEAPVT
jgi:Putative auto-transporter adhesin, head GIN domain